MVSLETFPLRKETLRRFTKGFVAEIIMTVSIETLPLQKKTLRIIAREIYHLPPEGSCRYNPRAQCCWRRHCLEGKYNHSRQEKRLWLEFDAVFIKFPKVFDCVDYDCFPERMDQAATLLPRIHLDKSRFISYCSFSRFPAVLQPESVLRGSQDVQC